MVSGTKVEIEDHGETNKDPSKWVSKSESIRVEPKSETNHCRQRSGLLVECRRMYGRRLILCRTSPVENSHGQIEFKEKRLLIKKLSTVHPDTRLMTIRVQDPTFKLKTPHCVFIEPITNKYHWYHLNSVYCLLLTGPHLLRSRPPRTQYSYGRGTVLDLKQNGRNEGRTRTRRSEGQLRVVGGYLREIRSYLW